MPVLTFQKKLALKDQNNKPLSIDEKVYIKYAERYLHADQIDEIDLSKIPSYTIPSERCFS